MNRSILLSITVFLLLSGLAAGLNWLRPAICAAQHEGHGGGGAPASSPAQAMPADTAGEPPVIEIPPEQQQTIGLKSVPVAVMPLVKVIRTVGRIDYDERKLATVNAKYGGWLETLHADYTGRPVKKGEALAEIYSPELYATQLDLLNALAWEQQSPLTAGNPALAGMLAADAAALRKAAEERLRLWDLTGEQIDAIKASGRPWRTITLLSPVNGYIVQKMAVAGMRLMPGDKLFDIADLSSVWVLADIYENDLASVKVGQKAAISLGYLPGRQFTSTVEYVNPTLAGDTRTVKIRFTIPNPGLQLKPQMFTNVQLDIDLGRRLAVPVDAVIDTGVRRIVYVDRGEGQFEPRAVQLGETAAGLVEVKQGLRAGEQVVASAIFLIDSEAQLKGVTPVSGNGQ